MKCTQRLYLTKDRKKLVAAGDKHAASLYSVPGDEIPQSAAEMFGLVDGHLKKFDPGAGSKEDRGGSDKEKTGGSDKEKTGGSDKEDKSDQDKSEGGAVKAEASGDEA